MNNKGREIEDKLTEMRWKVRGRKGNIQSGVKGKKKRRKRVKNEKREESKRREGKESGKEVS